jgi:hypothetical protein
MIFEKEVIFSTFGSNIGGDRIAKTTSDTVGRQPERRETAVFTE